MNTIIWRPEHSERGVPAYVPLIKGGPFFPTRVCHVEITGVEDPKVGDILRDSLQGIIVPAIFGDGSLDMFIEFWEVASFTRDIETALRLHNQFDAAELFHGIMPPELFYVHRKGCYKIL
ncbi:MAG: hypothetical protein WC437_00165 [Patescibacteria group bacterium]